MNSSHVNTEQTGDWEYLRKEIWRRTTQPISKAPFVIYVVLAIIGLGCLGIWVELIKIAISAKSSNYDGVMTALATFYPALVGSTSLQLALASTGRGDKVLVSIAFLVSFVAFASVILISIFYVFYPTWCLAFGIFLSVFSVWLWWVSNGDDPTFMSAPVDAASGGDTERPLKGDTSEFVE